MKLKRAFMDVIVRPITKAKMALIADRLFDINIHHGRGGIRSAEIHSVASGRISGIVTREIPITQETCHTEQHKFTVRDGVLRYLGHKRRV